jgi:CheY-like chemotaxis protein
MAAHSSIDLSGTHVLVVDDDADNREMLAAVLEQSGAQVTLADSAAEALTAYQRQRPHLVISDIGLPDEDGFGLLRRLRALPSPDGVLVPAIALTGYGSPADRAEAGNVGFQAHLTKPVELDVMLRTVAGVLRPG